MPCQVLASTPGTDSATVGTSGSAPERVAVVTASARTLPVLMVSIDRPCFQGGQRRPGDFGRERREFAGGLRPDRTLPRSSCLARCSKLRWRGPTLPLRVTLGWTGGLYVFEPPAGGHRYTSRAAPAEPEVVKD